VSSTIELGVADRVALPDPVPDPDPATNPTVTPAATTAVVASAAIRMPPLLVFRVFTGTAAKVRYRHGREVPCGHQAQIWHVQLGRTGFTAVDRTGTRAWPVTAFGPRPVGKLREIIHVLPLTLACHQS